MRDQDDSLWSFFNKLLDVTPDGGDSGRHLNGLPLGGKLPRAWEGDLSLDLIISLMQYAYMRIKNDRPLGQLTDAFKGLADPTRLRIMNLLLHGELCVCHIQRVLGASQPNVSRHLNYLKHSGLVLDRPEGFRVYYRLANSRNEPLKTLFAFLHTAFKGDENLRQDLEQLERAVREGTCVLRHNRLSPRQAVETG